jgi:DNA-binding transcriptional ArsR family regulator
MKHATAYKQQTRLFQALSHPVRLRILDILAQQEACVCHLTTILRQRQPYVSQQLAILREAGLVTDRREGTLIYYHLADEGLGRLVTESRSLAAICAGESLAFPPIPEGAVGNCPCPRCSAA